MFCVCIANLRKEQYFLVRLLNQNLILLLKM